MVFRNFFENFCNNNKNILKTISTKRVEIADSKVYTQGKFSFMWMHIFLFFFNCEYNG